MPKIGDAPNGENSSLAGTEKVPLTGSKWAYISTIKNYVKTITDTLYSAFNHTHADSDHGGVINHTVLTNAGTSLHVPTYSSDSTTYLDGNGAWTVPPGGLSSVYDSDIILQAITTNNADSDHHGFLPKLDGDNTHFLSGLATWLTPVYSSGFIYGLTLSNNGSDATNDIDIATGKCIDSTNAVNMVLASALTKQLDVAWAVGTNQGGLDTGSIADTTYHIWLIKRSDTGVVDALFSASASAPTMPANYDYKRRIGSIIRASGAIVGFVQDGDTFVRKVPIQSVAATNPGTSAVTRTLNVPIGVRVQAILGVLGVGTDAASQPGGIYISDLSVTDAAASGGSVFNVGVYVATISTVQNGAETRCFTNTSAQVRSRLEQSTANTVLYIATLGWIDSRGRLS